MKNIEAAFIPDSVDIRADVLRINGPPFLKAVIDSIVLRGTFFLSPEEDAPRIEYEGILDLDDRAEILRIVERATAKRWAVTRQRYLTPEPEAAHS